MTTGRIKLVLILAGLVLAPLLFWSARSFGETWQPNIKTDGGQKDDANSLASTGGPAIPVIGSEYFYKMLLSVILVIALGIAVVYVSKKLLPRFTNLQGKQIRVLETTHLAPRKGLHLIEVGAHRLLIASTNESVTMLADVTDSPANFAAELEARSQTGK